MIKIKTYFIIILLVLSADAITPDMAQAQVLVQTVEKLNSGAPSKVNKKTLLYPMSMMSDDPLVKKIKEWQKDQALKLKTEKRNKNNRSTTGNSFAGNSENLPDKGNINSSHIIKLEVSEDEAELVNSGKYFVFGDKTNRDNGLIIDNKKQNKKNQSIETLRRLMSKK